VYALQKRSRTTFLLVTRLTEAEKRAINSKRNSHVQQILLVGLGGFLGANARYFISVLMVQWLGVAFPYGTLIVNVTGSLLLGVFIGLVRSRMDVPLSLQLLIGSGFFGAYTTFSTYAVETVLLAHSGSWAGVLVNVLGTNLLCLLAALAGFLVFTRWLP
jgi:fluoride exporter